MCVRRLMTDSEDIINGKFILMKGCSRGYVTDENVKQVCITNAKLLCQFVDALSCLHQVDPTHDSIREAGALFLTQ